MLSDKCIAIIGPTGVGKTRLALQLAQILPIEIISLDSMLFYKGMDIGTAKPTLEEQVLVKHHMIDILNPTDSYSVANYIYAIIPIIQAVIARGNIPVLVGGTMMYVWAMLQGLNSAPVKDVAYRQLLIEQGESSGWEVLWQQLFALNPHIAHKIAKQDKHRIIRALEIAKSSESQVNNLTMQVPLAIFSLLPDSRAALYQAINARFVQMLEVGLLTEVESLYQQFPQLTMNSGVMLAVGYRQVSNYIYGYCDYATMLDKGQQATRNLAKRQLTWLRKINGTACLVDIKNQNFDTAFQQIASYIKDNYHVNG